MPTYLDYRWQVAADMGPFFQSIATSGTTTTLVDTNYLISSTISPDYYDDWYIYRPSALTNPDQVRRVASYDPAAGTITPDHAWTNAPIVFEQYELHGLIHPKTDMLAAINAGLKRCLVTKEATLTPVALAQRHSLATLGWIDEPWKVRSVGFLSSGQLRAQNDPYLQTVRGYVTNEAGVFYINHPCYTFAATDTIYLWTVASGYDLIAFANGTLKGGDIGGDTETAPTDLAWLSAAAQIEAYTRLTLLLDQGSNQRLQANRLEAAATFTSLRKSRFQLPALTFEPLVALGPYPNAVGYY